MRYIVGDEKPALADLAHHGVKGMKWGHRKKYSTSDIKDARTRQSARREEVNTAANRLNLSTGTKGEKSAVNNYVKKVDAYNGSTKDAAIAARMTKGEKTAALIIGGPFGLLAIGGNAAIVKSLDKKAKK